MSSTSRSAACAGTAAAFGRVRDACAAAGRAADSLRYSAAQVVCCATSPAGLERRAAAIGKPPDELRTEGLAGSPAEVTEKLGQFAAAGAATAYLQVLDLHDLDHLELLAAQVLPQVR